MFQIFHRGVCLEKFVEPTLESVILKHQLLLLLLQEVLIRVDHIDVGFRGDVNIFRIL